MQTLTLRKTQAAQVYFPCEIYLRLKRLAKMQNKPVAAWIRELTIKEVQKSEKKRKKFTDLQTFSWPNIPHNLSERVDEIVYGDPHHEKE